MKNLTKISIVALATLTLLTGCEEHIARSATELNTYDANSVIKVYCDKDTNIEYFIFNKYKSGGISLRVNSDGTPKSCK